MGGGVVKSVATTAAPGVRVRRPAHSRGNGATFNNLDSDFFFQRAIDTGVVERLMAEPPPRGPRPEVRGAVRGYVEGYNRYLADTGVDNLSDPRCRGMDWVRPISELDAYRRFYQLGILASQGAYVTGVSDRVRDEIGLEEGDIILQINTTVIRSDW